MSAAEYPRLVDLPLSRITADLDLLPRVEMVEWARQRYASLKAAGIELLGPHGDDYPVVFWDHSTNWLAKGFHRHGAHEDAGIGVMRCLQNLGTRRDALLYAVSADLTNALALTPDDVRRNVCRLIQLEPLPDEKPMPDREIARRCGVSPTTVGVYREHLRRAASVQTGQTKQTNEAVIRWRKTERSWRTIQHDFGTPRDARETAWLAQGEEIIQERRAALLTVGGSRTDT